MVHVHQIVEHHLPTDWQNQVDTSYIISTHFLEMELSLFNLDICCLAWIIEQLTTEQLTIVAEMTGTQSSK